MKEHANERSDDMNSIHEFIAGGFVFKSMNNADGHHNVVKVNWAMVPASAETGSLSLFSQ
jgi:hypothetical protein